MPEKLDAHFLADMTADPTGEQAKVAAGAYHDWLADHDQASLAAVLASLDGLIGAALERNLQLIVNPIRHTVTRNGVSVGTELGGWTVSVMWNGLTIRTERIDLH